MLELTEKQVHDQCNVSDSTRPKGTNKPTRTTKHSLSRMPSLPSIMISNLQESQDEEEVEFSMGNLIRQASLSDFTTFKTPKKHVANKNDPRNVRINRQRQRIGPELMKSKSEGSEESRLSSSKNNEEGCSSSLPFANMEEKRSMDEIKAQIKCWAKTVASNVR